MEPNGQYPVRITCLIQTSGGRDFWQGRVQKIEFYGPAGTIQKTISES